MSLVPFLLLLLGAAVTCAIATWAARALARRTGFLDRPVGRKDHAEATPLLGGLALYATLCLLPELLLAFAPVLAGALPGLSEAFVAELIARSDRLHVFAGSATLIFAVGLLDDRRALHPGIKLAGQVAAALWIALAGVRIDLFGNDVANVLGTILWIALVGNAFNFFDNMNGLLAGVTGLSAALLLGLALSLGQYALGALVAVLVGACLGFLPWNFPRARIFMGDAGSLLLGHVFAVLCVQATYVRLPGTPWIACIVPPSLLALPLLDLAYVTWDRWRDGVPLTRGDHRHLSHRLLRLGMSRTRATWVVWLATFVMGSFAVLLPLCDAGSAFVCLAGQGAFFLLLEVLFATARSRS